MTTDDRNIDSAREDEIMRLARQAYRHLEPSDARVELAARRIERRISSRPRPRSSRRFSLVLAFLVVFVGALAYAASGGGPRRFGTAPPSNAPLRVSTQQSLGGAVTLLPRLRAEASPAPAPAGAPGSDESEADVAGSGALRGAGARDPLKPPSSAVGVASPAPAASWRAVDEALDAKDDNRAKQALEGLAKSGDATTRAKARLGLGQLARAKGDCATARRIADEVSAQPDIDASVKKRARALSAECQ